MEKASGIMLSAVLAAGLTATPNGSGEELKSYEGSGLVVIDNETTITDFDSNDELERPLIPAEPVQNIELSNDFDGILAAQGFTVYVDEERMEDSLEPNQAVLIEQEESTNTTYGLYEFGARRIVDTFEDSSIMHDLADILPETPNYSSYAIGDAGFYDNDQLPESFAPLGGGLDPHATGPAEITLTYYSLNEDGMFDVTDVEHATATITPNITCTANINAAPVQIASEIVPTSEQKAAMCNAAQLYQDIIPDGFDFRFDTTLSETGMDSASDRDPENNSSGGNILLTYPYQNADEPVSPKMVEQIALHEILHTRYFEADEALKQQIDDAYAAMVNAMGQSFDSYQEKVWDGTWRGAEPIWDCITESTYLEPGSSAGHPWDNATEMASSLTSVLNYNSAEFLEKFSELDQNSQTAVLNAAYAAETLINSSTGDVESVIPNFYETLETAAQLQAAS